jgi:hypothetical protein
MSNNTAGPGDPGTQALDNTKALLDAQLAALSERLFEAGKRADAQLTAWASFCAVTVLLLTGTGIAVPILGVTLSAMVAAAVAFAASCVFYYRSCLGFATVGRLRFVLRERRSIRFLPLAVPLPPSQTKAEDVAEDVLAELDRFVPEYPGFVFCSVLMKDEARRLAGRAARSVAVAHYASVMLFLATPWLLAAALLIRATFAAEYVIVTVLGLAFVSLGDLIIVISARMPSSLSGNRSQERKA